MQYVRRCLGKEDKYSRVSAEEAGQLEAGKPKNSQLKTLKQLLPYLWPKGEVLIRLCVLASLTLMLLAKLCTISSPLAYKYAVDILSNDDTINHSVVNNDDLGDGDKDPSDAIDNIPITQSSIIYPVWCILLYGLLQYLGKFCADLRDTIFIRVTNHALKSSAIKTFDHLHSLSLKFHLHRQTGGVLRAIDRGTQGIQFLLTFVLFNIGPTILEICMVAVVLFYLYPIWFSLITLATMFTYIFFTLSITQVSSF
jgi:ATP-binding cassette, subfamily B, heavy metal transporter